MTEVVLWSCVAKIIGKKILALAGAMAVIGAGAVVAVSQRKKSLNK